MGYTHYITRKRDLTDEEWTRLCKFMHLMQAKLKDPLLTDRIHLAGGNGVGKPFIDETLISFNGVDDDSHETMWFPKLISQYDPFEQGQGREQGAAAWHFCKTARKPYDRAVLMFLNAVQRIAPESVELGSDGGPQIFGTVDGAVLGVMASL